MTGPNSSNTSAPTVSPVWLVLIGIASVQLGAGFAKSLFDDVAPTTIVWLRLATSVLVLVAVLRPRVRGRSREDWAVVVAFGLSLGLMNWAIYQSFARIPLGVAVTIEFIGPLALAVLGSRRPRDLLWVLLAGAGVLLLGFDGLGYLDEGYYAMSLLSTLFGGGMSSRLFQEVREKRGLVYSIYSFHSAFLDGGLFGLYAGTGASEVRELVPVICDELVKLTRGVTAEELERGRAQVRALELGRAQVRALELGLAQVSEAQVDCDRLRVSRHAWRRATKLRLFVPRVEGGGHLHHRIRRLSTDGAPSDLFALGSSESR